MGPSYLCLYWEEGILVHAVYVYLAVLLHYSLILNDSYARPELKSTDLTECQKRRTINENRQQLNTAKRQKSSHGSVVKLNLHMA